MGMNELVDLGALHPGLARLERPATSTTPGLSRSISTRFTIDPLLVRVAFLLLIPVGGVGVITYTWGVLLTPREGHDVPPIARLAPVFSTWAPRNQWFVVGGSSVLASTAISQFVPISPVPVLLLGLAVLFVKRRRQPTAVPPTGLTEHEPQLPVVDLYAPEPETRPVDEALPPDSAGERAPVSWFGALGIVLLGATLLHPASLLLGGLFMGAAATLGVVGVATLAWALLIRSRRLPSAFLIGLLLAAGMFGTLATSRVSTQDLSSVSRDSTTIIHSYVAEKATLDLRHLSGDTVADIRIHVVASEIVVLLPEEPEDVQTIETLSKVSMAPMADSSSEPGTASGLRLRIEATVSEVTVEYPQ